MNYTDFGLPADSKANKIKAMRQFQLAKIRVEKGIKNPKDFAIVFGGTPESWAESFERRTNKA